MIALDQEAHSAARRSDPRAAGRVGGAATTQRSFAERSARFNLATHLSLY